MPEPRLEHHAHPARSDDRFLEKTRANYERLKIRDVIVHDDRPQHLPPRKRVVAGALVWVLGLFFGCVGIGLSGYSGVYGAKLGGLTAGGLGLQFLIPALGGWALGLVITLGMVFWLRRTSRFSLALPLLAITAPAVVFVTMWFLYVVHFKR